MEEAAIENVFAADLPGEVRARLAEVGPRVGDFLTRLLETRPGCPGVAFITSGRTSVPLERKSVRFIVNISSGARGAGLAEALMVEHGWACILLHHDHAARPFRRKVDALTDEALFQRLRPTPQGRETRAEVVIETAGANFAKTRDLLLRIPFNTVMEYLYLLREVSRAVSAHAGFADRPLLCFAAAAVADYYVPLARQAAEKISGGEGLVLRLENVPKMLGVLKKSWLRRPQAAVPGKVVRQPYLVSFKLETNEAEMRTKSVKNLRQYANDAVVGNILHNYHEMVWIYTHDGDDHNPLWVKKEPGRTIESYLCDFFISKVKDH
ncbi:unnamed protein product [Phytomonas sp. Hart1]|nr:unnamed protein product [Phytomonas sp. Hart1]|eukprot:CCW70986.1 unnamed protein product [Phytomonas sp. isolate Hart1]